MSNCRKETNTKPLIYVPDGAKINVKQENLPPPKTRYDKRQAIFPREEVERQITKKDSP